MRSACLIVFSLLSLSAQAQSRSVAITVDDLICANCAPRNQTGAKASETMEATNSRLVHKLSKANVPDTGFVITKTLEQSGAAGKRALQLWLNAGFDLGNHT